MSLKITVVGLGYVGLPLAVELSKEFSVTGYDHNKSRIAQLKKNLDPSGQLTQDELYSSSILFSSSPNAITGTDIVIITVPTPIDSHNSPDLTPLIEASKTVGARLKKGAIVCYESTVYPGATEEQCIPILEKVSGMKWKEDFFVGYSPERINPGDRVHTLQTVVKVVAGDTLETLDTLSEIYGTVVKAGIHRASSIKVAEAAKVIENTQRDINIAFMNELKIIFDKMGISTKEVLEAAKTKWNFLNFTPGLVGGHCIGVDPYYLAFKAEEVGHHPEVIKAGRRINDTMGLYFAKQILKTMIDKDIHLEGAKVLVMGITFKENVPDIRNSQVVTIIRELEEFGVIVDVVDPCADYEEVKNEYGISLVEKPFESKLLYDGAVLAVSHREFLEIGRAGIACCLKERSVLFDVRDVL